jgi:hypothetical protein
MIQLRGHGRRRAWELNREWMRERRWVGCGVVLLGERKVDRFRMNCKEMSHQKSTNTFFLLQNPRFR